MKKQLSLAMALLLALSLTACGNAAAPSTSSSAGSSAAASSAATSAPEPTNPMAGFDPSRDSREEGQSTYIPMPTIAGSNAYDVTVSLEKIGLPNASRIANDDGYTFSAENSDYGYTITTNDDYAISYAEFYVYGEDNGYLAYCATYPHDEADQTEKSWVEDNAGTEATTTIGDADYSLSVDTQNRPYLTISAIGRSEYLAQKMAG